MKCEVCGRDKPVTYHNSTLGKRSVCAECIRAKMLDSLGQRLAEGILTFARAVQDAQQRIVTSFGIPNPATAGTHILTVDGDDWSLKHPMTCKHEWMGEGCEVSAAASADLAVALPADGRYWCWPNLDDGGIRVLRIEPETPQEPEPMKPQGPPETTHQVIPPYCWTNVNHTPYAAYNNDAGNRSVSVERSGTLWLEGGDGWRIRPRAEEP